MRARRVLDVVALLDVDRGLEHDRAGVDSPGGEQVHGAAGDLDPGSQRLFDGVHPATERGQQRGVNIEDGVGKCREHVVAEHAVVAGADNQLDLRRAQRIDHGAVARRDIVVEVADGQ